MFANFIVRRNRFRMQALPPLFASVGIADEDQFANEPTGCMPLLFSDRAARGDPQ
jgi:hypothetical protein